MLSSRARVFVIPLLCVALFACSGLLGDFTISDGGTTSDATADQISEDVQQTDVTTKDVVADSPADVQQDVAPTCGLIGLQCCTNQVCNTGSCCAGSCVDTTKDQKNCGACGHDCLLGQCGASVCTPTSIATLTSTEPISITVDANAVYWGQANGGGSLQAGAVYSCDKVNGCGNNPTALFKQVDYPRVIVLNGTDLYALDGNVSTIDVCKTTGCNGAPTQYTQVSSLTSISITQSTLFYLAQGQLFQSNLDEQFPLALSSNTQSGSDVINVGNYAYYTNTSNVRWAPQGQANGAVDFFSGVAGEMYERIASDGQNVFFHAYVNATTDDSVFSCPAGQACSSRTTLATGQHFSPTTAGLAGDSGYAYWTSGSGKDVYVRKCAATGCNKTPTDVAHVVTTSFAWVGGVAVDAAYVYFPVESGGTTTVYRVVK